MDLNVIIENCGPRDPDNVIQEKLSRCRALGFREVAMSVIVEVKNAKPVIPAPPDLKLYTSNNGPHSLKVYSRLTVKISEPKFLYNLKKETSKYDLLALEPQNLKVLQYIGNGDAELDILTFNLADHLDYSIFKAKITELEKRGVCTEINYGPAQMGNSSRRNIICNGQNLFEKFPKNIILSNGISDTFRLRGPKDAQSIGTLFLMPVTKCHDAVFRTARGAIKLAKNRSNPTSRAIEEIEVKDETLDK